jgi:hypothetical protein
LIKTLDKAGDYLEIAYKANTDPEEKPDLKKGLAQLKTTRSLLVMINSEDKFKTPDVLDALPLAAEPLDELVTELNKGKPHSVRRVNNAIDEVKGTTNQLFSKLPGIVVRAVGNTQNEKNKLMVNGPVGKSFLSSQGGGGTFISEGNTANGDFMINSALETEVDLGTLIAQWEAQRK